MVIVRPAHVVRPLQQLGRQGVEPHHLRDSLPTAGSRPLATYHGEPAIACIPRPSAGVRHGRFESYPRSQLKVFSFNATI